jgi:hypothetical protein
MKLKLLLFVLFVSCGMFGLRNKVNAQADTIKYLVISEARLDNAQYDYVELSNRSATQAVDLSNFEFGNLTAWNTPWNADAIHHLMLPQHILWPGESYVIAQCNSLGYNMKKVDPERWIGRQYTQMDMFKLADLQLYNSDMTWGDYTHKRLPDGTVMDSVSPHGQYALESWNGRDVYFIRQHLSEIDSVVTDEVNGDYSDADGTPPDAARDVAGVTNATAHDILVRKYSIKEGNHDWQKQQGVDLTDSEWMPIPVPKNGWGYDGIRVWSYWTVGNDGNFTLTPDDFVSSTATMDWADTILTVPWGTRNEYKVMKLFEKTKGLAWVYHYSPNQEDSAFASARTGDVLTIYAAGNNLQIWNWHVVVAEPTASANVVCPKNHLQRTRSGTIDWGNGDNHYFEVTQDAPGMDTIYNVGFATSVDTLYKYLEKAPAASWKIEPVDGMDNRPDVKTGDLLRVTAKDGSVKDYFIKTNIYYPDHDAYLSSITWPDIPDFYRGIFGWKGDTIPGFAPQGYAYTVEVPADVEGIPEMTTTTERLNTTVTTDRATNINGSIADRTITFNTAAEDDTTLLSYKVTLNKEKNPADIQPFSAEPFFSQRTYREWWGGSAMEVYNPGNQPIDLSHYMLLKGGAEGTPAAAIEAGTTTDDWSNRYNRYIPGRVWQSDAQWQVQPYMAEQDLTINPIVQGGDCFVAAGVGLNNQGQYPSNIIPPSDVDVDFFSNPWGDTMLNGGTGGNPVQGWQTNTFYLYKITNDSVWKGLKPATDPADFQVIDVFGNGDGTDWKVGGKVAEQIMKYERKPAIYKGNPNYGNTLAGSFGDPDNNDPSNNDSEWDWWNRGSFDQMGYGWPVDVACPMLGLGSHTIDPLTFYMSTVTSTKYKVSPGYSMNESILGVVTGTTVDQFLADINKQDPGETITIMSGGTELSGSDQLTDGDNLKAVSADGNNTSQYSIGVTDNGLSHDALLTSDTYTVTNDAEAGTGTVGGFDMSTLLSAVKDGVIVPPNASMTIIDANGSYVPLKKLNYDTTYVDVTVNDQTYFVVVAEDGTTTMTYQLTPDATSSDAYVTSMVYVVDQDNSTIMDIPSGTTPAKLLSNLIPAPGATIKLVDKAGIERTTGHFAADDKVVVTAADGVTQKVYFLATLVTQAQYGEFSGNYLAFVMSDVYSVDQLGYTIGDGATKVSVGDDNATFLGNLMPSFGASIVVVNSDGVETTDPLASGDMLKVTAANGKTVVMYDITFTGVKTLTDSNMKLYPNPTTGQVNITGLESGYRIRVFNVMGATIRTFNVNSTTATFSLSNEPAGLYFVTVDKADQFVARFKVIRK